MERLKKIGLIITLIMVGFACSDSSTGPNNNDDGEEDSGEDTEETTNVQDDKDNIQSSMDGAVASLSDLQDGEFVQNMNSFMYENSGEWTADITTGFINIFRTQVSQDNIRFDYSSKTGVYVWDNSTGSFSDPTSSEDIVVEFPSSENSSSNDAVFTFSEYADASTTIDGAQVYLPTKIQTELAIDGNAVFGFDLNEFNFSDSEGWPMPTSLDLEILTAPFTHALTFERNDDRNYSFTFDLTNDGQLAAGISLDLELANSNFSTLQEEDLETLEGSLKIGSDMTVDFSIENLGNFILMEDPSENDFNSLIDAEVLYEGEKVGDLEYSAEEDTIIIIYSDGSSEPIDRYIDGFADELEKTSQFQSFVEDWVDFEN